MTEPGLPFSSWDANDDYNLLVGDGEPELRDEEQEEKMPGRTSPITFQTQIATQQDQLVEEGEVQAQEDADVAQLSSIAGNVPTHIIDALFPSASWINATFFGDQCARAAYYNAGVLLEDALPTMSMNALTELYRTQFRDPASVAYHLHQVVRRNLPKYRPVKSETNVIRIGEEMIIEEPKAVLLFTEKMEPDPVIEPQHRKTVPKASAKRGHRSIKHAFRVPEKSIEPPSPAAPPSPLHIPSYLAPQSSPPPMTVSRSLPPINVVSRRDEAGGVIQRQTPKRGHEPVLVMMPLLMVYEVMRGNSNMLRNSQAQLNFDIWSDVQVRYLRHSITMTELHTLFETDTADETSAIALSLVGWSTSEEFTGIKEVGELLARIFNAKASSKTKLLLSFALIHQQQNAEGKEEVYALACTLKCQKINETWEAMLNIVLPITESEADSKCVLLDTALTKSITARCKNVKFRVRGAIFIFSSQNVDIDMWNNRLSFVCAALQMITLVRNEEVRTPCVARWYNDKALLRVSESGTTIDFLNAKLSATLFEENLASKRKHVFVDTSDFTPFFTNTTVEFATKLFVGNTKTYSLSTVSGTVLQKPPTKR